MKPEMGRKAVSKEYTYPRPVSNVCVCRDCKRYPTCQILMRIAVKEKILNCPWFTK